MQVYSEEQVARRKIAARKRYESNRARYNAASRRWAKCHKDSHWKGYLKRRFGITPEAYVQLLISQGGVCAICKKLCSSGRLLAVDHCHKTGEVRGLLCGVCNRMLGNAQDEASTLRAAADYLEKADHPLPLELVSA